MSKVMQRLCSRCHTVQPCEDTPIQINYGFNDKEHVLIEGVERICKVCGWHVDDAEVSVVNREIALKALKEKGNEVKSAEKPATVPDIAQDDTDNEATDKEALEEESEE